MEVIVRELCKSYGGERVLDRVSLTLWPGVTCLMAPSGAGKTTLLRLLMGLEQADSGLVEGLAGKRLAAVFQEDRLLDRLDQRGNLRFVLGRDYDAAAATALLEELGLSGAEGKPVREFSGGMRRRLALARALLAPWDLLLLDEPFTGLDDENRRRAMDCILERTAGRPVLLVSHDRSDAEGLHARIVTL